MRQKDSLEQSPQGAGKETSRGGDRGVCSHGDVGCDFFFPSQPFNLECDFLPKTMTLSCLSADGGDGGESRQVASTRAGAPGSMRSEVASRETNTHRRKS